MISNIKQPNEPSWEFVKGIPFTVFVGGGGSNYCSLMSLKFELYGGNLLFLFYRSGFNRSGGSDDGKVLGSSNPFPI